MRYAVTKILYNAEYATKQKDNDRKGKGFHSLFLGKEDNISYNI